MVIAVESIERIVFLCSFWGNSLLEQKGVLTIGRRNGPESRVFVAVDIYTQKGIKPLHALPVSRSAVSASKKSENRRDFIVFIAVGHKPHLFSNNKIFMKNVFVINENGIIGVIFNMHYCNLKQKEQS